ncbi:hypothetical protein B0H12DRAFT_1164373 [Mycena haematopus]|nr:hypothetical protein B0H12DRAFT_1164373 [Mycena haematopus]
MHCALRIPELVEMICAQAGAEGIRFGPGTLKYSDAARDLAVLARTCTTFLNPSLDILWSSQRTIVNVLRCMPDRLWEIQIQSGILDIRLRRPIIRTDWERALFYLHRVKHFSMSEGFRSLDFFVTLSLCLPAQCIFPNLRRLEWNPRGDVFDQLHLFLSPKIEDLHLEAIRTISHLSVLSNLAIKCPSLKNFTIRTPELDWEMEVPFVSMCVCTLMHIEVLSVRELDQAALVHLAQLPNLKSLRIAATSQFYHPSPDVFPSASGTFPSLETLAFVSAPLSYATTILELASNCPLVSLKMSGGSYRPTATDARKFYAALAIHSSHTSLRSIAIPGDPNGYYEPDTPIPPSATHLYAVGGDTLHPLFSFANLVTVSLAHPVGFDLDDAVIGDMARAWPCIQYLALTASPARHIPSRVTLEGLYAFAKYCSRLCNLYITFDATVVPDMMKNDNVRVAQQALESLDVDLSIVADPRLVGKFLAAIFPGLGAIGTLYLDLIDDQGPLERPVDSEVLASHLVWQEVLEACLDFNDESSEARRNSVGILWL